MGHRLSKIYTRTGDNGTTGLADNTRVSKDHLRVEVFGTLDELNSYFGLILSEHDLSKSIQDLLILIQNQLFDLGSEFCLPGYKAITEQHITYLEQQLDALNQHLPPLKEFILPGGHKTAALCHITRTICRRAERRAVSLSLQESVSPLALKYLNRLSDLLFVLARSINQAQQVKEPLWQHER